jgi:sodium/proline symporter
MSGWLLMGLPGAIYLSGLSESWIAIGLIIGAWLNWYWLLDVYAFILKSKIMHSRYQIILQVVLMIRKDLRIFSAVIILVFFAIYCASGMVAGARLFENLFTMSYTTALWLGALQQSVMFVLVVS